MDAESDRVNTILDRARNYSEAAGAGARSRAGGNAAGGGIENASGEVSWAGAAAAASEGARGA